MAIGSDQAIDSPDVLLTGASGQIGVFAIPRLLAAGFRVVAVSRRGRPALYDGNEQVEWLDQDQATVVAKRCRYLLSAGPLELAKKFLLASETFERAVVFSSSSVETKQASGHPAERRQIEDMLSLESELHSVAEGRGLKLVIFRPTLIYGCGMDTNISRLASWIKRFGFMPVNGAAFGLRQPVHADDLAAAAVTALQSRADLPRVLNLCGGDTLTYTDMVSRIFSTLGKPVRLLHLPQWLFVLVVNITRVIRPGTGVNSEMVRRQRLDLVFDDRQARGLLDYKPRPFQPVAGDFLLPDVN
jgi:nucleoside-diphosphate-sugar epimerase